MGSVRTLVIVSVIVILVIFLVNKYKKNTKNPVSQVPANLGVQAVAFFEQLLAFLPQINAEARKGGSVLDGTILVRGEEQGNYILSENGGLITYLGVNVYFSMNDEGRATSAIGEQLLFFTLRQFIKNEEEARGFFDHLSEPVLDLQEKENIIETKKMQFRFACDWNYSQAAKDEIPPALQHIKHPLVFSLEVTPLAIVEP